MVTSQSNLESRLVALVKAICAPLFTLFNFFVIRDEIYADIVTAAAFSRAIIAESRCKSVRHHIAELVASKSSRICADD